ncbi:MAG: hypothetical protein R6W06_04380 [Prochlorococcaceae cyanobacterium]
MKATIPASLAVSALAALSCCLALALILLPQRLAQRSRSAGILEVHLAADGRLWLWNQPLSAAELQAVLQRARSQPAWRALLLRPAPQTPWSKVLQLLQRLDAHPLTIDVELPSG